jgi:hypothetical protein
MTPSSGRRCRSNRFGTIAPISMMQAGRTAGLSIETFELDIDGSAERDVRAAQDLGIRQGGPSHRASNGRRESE